MIPIRDALPSRHFPVVTVALIVINLLVFLYQGYLHTQPDRLVDGVAWEVSDLVPPAFDADTYRAHRLSGGDPALYPVSADDYLILQYAIIPAELLGGEDLPPEAGLPLWLTILTGMFLHGGLMHLLGNMLYLWIFGDNVEDAMGPLRFLLFYILCGTAAALAQIAVDPGSAIPLIGASGAIAGVLAAYFMLYPQARVLTLVPIFFFIRLISLPAVFLLGFWFILQVISGAGALGSSGGVAWFAHIGGFIAGAVLVFPFRCRCVPIRLWQSIRRGRT